MRAEDYLREQFADLAQQRESAVLGMWIFLATEVMFFGGLITGYTVWRSRFPGAIALGSGQLDIGLGTLMTATMLVSSFTMALAVRSAQLGQRWRLSLNLLGTMLLGVVFLGLKFTEYYHKYLHHELPGSGFEWAGPDRGPVEAFLWMYFGLTGLHAVHMIVGLGIVGVVLLQALRGRYGALYHAAVENTGLYWHFVDVVWLFLYALLYLPGRHLRGG